MASRRKAIPTASKIGGIDRAMGFVFLVLAAGLAVAAYKSDGSTRLVLAAGCLLNLFAVAKGHIEGHPDIWRLKENNGMTHDNWRR